MEGFRASGREVQGGSSQNKNRVNVATTKECQNQKGSPKPQTMPYEDMVALDDGFSLPAKSEKVNACHAQQGFMEVQLL